MAEWLRRQPAKLMGIACASSNLVNVEFLLYFNRKNIKKSLIILEKKGLILGVIVINGSIFKMSF